MSVARISDYRTPAPVERPLPINIEAEQAVLGAVLVNNAAFHAIGLRLVAEHFSEEIHRRIWEVAASMIGAGQIASPVTLKSFLGEHDLGGITIPEYLARLCVESVPVVTAPDYARLVSDLFGRRQIIAAAQEAIEAAYDPPVGMSVEGMIDAAETSLMELRFGAASSGRRVRITAGTAAAELLADVDRMRAGEISALGATTGLPDLDKLTGGIMPGDLWVLAGRASMGKTIGGTSIAKAAAKSGVGTILFPFEIGPRQAAARILADLSYHPNKPFGYGDILRNQIDDDQRWMLDDAKRRLDNMPLVFDASGRATLSQIASRARFEQDRMGKAGTPLGLIVLDYLKFIKASDRYQGQRHYEVGEITVGLKEMARSLGVGVLLLAQVNRQTENRDDKRPGIADLRESGDIETDADVVMLFYRDAYYIERSADFRKGDPEATQRHIDAQHALEIILGKNRTGATPTLNVWCDVACSTIASQSRRGL